MLGERLEQAILQCASMSPSKQIRKTIGTKSPAGSGKDLKSNEFYPIATSCGHANSFEDVVRIESPSKALSTPVTSISGSWSSSCASSKESIKHSVITSSSESIYSFRSCSPSVTPQDVSHATFSGSGSSHPYLCVSMDHQANHRNIGADFYSSPVPLTIPSPQQQRRRMMVGGCSARVLTIITDQPEESSRSLNSYSTPQEKTRKKFEVPSPTRDSSVKMGNKIRKSPRSPHKSFDKHRKEDIEQQTQEEQKGGADSTEIKKEDVVELKDHVHCIVDKTVEPATEPSHHRKKATARRHDPARCCCGCCYVSQFAQPCCPSMSWCCCLRPTEEQPIHENAARCGCYKINCCGFVSGCMLTVPVCPWNEEPTCFFGINLCYLLPIPFYRHSGGRRGNMYFSNFTNEDQFVKPGQSHYIFTDEGIEMKHEEVWCLSTNVVEDFMPEICHCQCRCQ